MNPEAVASLKAATFPGPAGRLEGLWKEAVGPRRGGAVFAHPHLLHGGTLHNKVVARAAQALAAAGWETLRFNFRGVGVSDGRYDAGPGETEDFQAALDEVERAAGLPILAGGFSFGSTVGLRAIAGDPRVVAHIGVGLPIVTERASRSLRPTVPALFVAGDQDALCPPGLLRDFVADSGQIVVIEGVGHFFEGKLQQLVEAIGTFLARLSESVGRP